MRFCFASGRLHEIAT